MATTWGEPSQSRCKGDRPNTPRANAARHARNRLPGFPRPFEVIRITPSRSHEDQGEVYTALRPSGTQGSTPAAVVSKGLPSVRTRFTLAERFDVSPRSGFCQMRW